MENIKKLIFKGHVMLTKILLVFGVVFAAVFVALIISAGDKNTVEVQNIFLLMIVGMTAVFVMIGAFSYFRTKKKYKRLADYLIENGLSPDEEFEAIGKLMHCSKNMIINMQLASAVAVHMNMIEAYSKGSYKSGSSRILSVELTLYGTKKPLHCICIAPEIQNDLINRINKNKGVVLSEEERIKTEEENRDALTLKQAEPKKVYGAMVLIIFMVAMASGSYYYIQENRKDANLYLENAQKQAMNPEKYDYLSIINEKSDDEIQVVYDGEEGAYYMFLFNTAKYLFEGELTVYSGETEYEDLIVKGLQPQDYWVSDYLKNKNEPNGYEFRDVKYYESDQRSTIPYKRSYDTTSWQKYIVLNSEMMTIENIESILKEEKSYVEYEEVGESVYSFYEGDPVDLEEYYPEDETCVYVGIIDALKNEIRIYEYHQGEKDKLMSTIKY